MKAQNKIIATWCAAIATMFGISKMYLFFHSIDFFDGHSVYNDEGCVRTKVFGASEDQTRLNNNSIIMTEWKVVDYKVGEDRPGAIYAASGFRYGGTAKSAADFVENYLTIEELPIVGYPKGVDFHPHGMFVHKPDDTLYVINHALENGGERIDVFQIVKTATEDIDDMDNDVPIGLEFKYSITSDWMKEHMNGVLNSIVVVEPNKFYVTQYYDSALDRSTDGWINVDQREGLKRVNAVVLKRRLTCVWYCEYNNDESSSSPVQCRKVADDFVMANGMTTNADQSKIFVADTIDKTITVFDRDASTNDLNGRTSVMLSSAIDNIKFDEESGNVYGAGMSNLFHSFRNHELSPGQDVETSTSGMLELSLVTQKKKYGTKYETLWKAKEVLSTPKLNMATNGIRMNHYYVMSSGCGFDGILVCPVVGEPTRDEL